MKVSFKTYIVFKLSKLTCLPLVSKLLPRSAPNPACSKMFCASNADLLSLGWLEYTTPRSMNASRTKLDEYLLFLSS